MSRSGYSDGLDNWALITWRGQVKSALRGKRGQAFLRELLAALDSLPQKRLIAGEIVSESGECCTIGAVAKRRGTNLEDLDPDEWRDVGDAFGIAGQMAAEIEFMNDEYCEGYTPERRFERMRDWVARNIIVRPDELETGAAP